MATPTLPGGFPPGWDCPGPLNWQLHHRVLADLVDPDGSLPGIQPGAAWTVMTWASGWSSGATGGIAAVQGVRMTA
ncbi:hypothetical protein [Streptomyces sp. NPDC005408]|uniref:hypothetical protein n=1 Tax=Streptomyces sp. NPDC005408 TaxID=3155341 RepID=UPI0033BA5006